MAGAHPIELESFTTSSAALMPPSTKSTDPLAKGDAGRRASKAYEDPYGLVDATPRADTRVRRSNAVVRWFRQLGVMLRNNFTLTFLRYYRSTLLQIIAPFFFMLLLFIIQQAAKIRDIIPEPHPAPYPLPGIAPCKGNGHDPVCINAMFTPDNADARAIMSLLAAKNFQRTGVAFHLEPPLTALEVPTRPLGFVPVPSEAFIYDYVVAHPNVTEFGVAFTRTDNTFAYTLWYNASQTFNETQDVSEIYGIPLLSFVRGLDEAIASYTANAPINMDIQLKDWPIIPVPGESEAMIQLAGPSFFFGCAMVNFLMILNTIVGEKEYRLRHGMQMMGLKSSVYWVSWFLVNVVIVFFSALLEVTFGIAFGFNVFTNASFFVLFLLFFLFGLAMITMAFFVTTLVRKVKAAVAVGMLILVIGLVFQIAMFTSTFTSYIWWSDSTDKAGWIVLMFLPFFNFGKVYVDIAISAAGVYNFATGLVELGPGFAWDDLYHPIPQDLRPPGNYSFPPPVQGFYFLLMDLAFYAVLTWYFDNVIPDEFGQCRPPWFFLTPSYWGITSCRARGDDPLGTYACPPKEDDEDDDVYAERQAACDGERSGGAAIRLVNLRKVYNDGLLTAKRHRKVAVHGSSWTLREGRLLALLGQNGAGKSTTMNMLCGFTKASAGNAFMYGRPINTHMEELRSMMGVCPQHDILFNDLTAMEHIRLYCGIKNIAPEAITVLARERLEAVRLWKVRDRKAGTYSGGMKRRLSVAISTIGDPKIVFMDEPTTGMDPLNRRHVWSFIEKFKRGRVIVLTTHSMEEADILGDQIAIMALGKLRAIGAPIRLKSKYGAGYRVSLVCREPEVPAVKADVLARLPALQLEDDSAGALIFQVPAAAIGELPDLVNYLDGGGSGLVREWGISQTTLEDVFLRIIREINPTANVAELRRQQSEDTAAAAE